MGVDFFCEFPMFPARFRRNAKIPVMTASEVIRFLNRVRWIRKFLLDRESHNRKIPKALKSSMAKRASSSSKLCLASATVGASRAWWWWCCCFCNSERRFFSLQPSKQAARQSGIRASFEERASSMMAISGTKLPLYSAIKNIARQFNL